MDATIKNLQHTCDLDLSVLLVGPGGGEDDPELCVGETGNTDAAPATDDWKVKKKKKK